MPFTLPFFILPDRLRLLFASFAEIFSILGQRDAITDSASDRRATGLVLFQHNLCVHGMGKLLGIGSQRLEKLRAAAVRGEDCPMDGRVKEMNCRIRFGRLSSHKRELILDFLTYLYVKHSEPMPEVRTNPTMQTDRKLQFRKVRGKRPKQLKKRNDKLDEVTGKDLRMLPPGTYSDYLKLFKAKHPETQVSFKLFTRVLWLTINRISCASHFFLEVLRFFSSPLALFSTNIFQALLTRLFLPSSRFGRRAFPTDFV